VNKNNINSKFIQILQNIIGLPSLEFDPLPHILLRKHEFIKRMKLKKKSIEKKKFLKMQQMCCALPSQFSNLPNSHSFSIKRKPNCRDLFYFTHKMQLKTH